MFRLVGLIAALAICINAKVVDPCVGLSKSECSKQKKYCLYERRKNKCRSRGDKKGLTPPGQVKELGLSTTVNGFGTLSYAVPKGGYNYYVELSRAPTEDDDKEIQFMIFVEPKKVQMTWFTAPSGAGNEWKQRTLDLDNAENRTSWWPDNLLEYNDSERWFWVSIDAGSNNRLTFGFGYQMVLNTLLKHEANVRAVNDALDNEDYDDPDLLFHRALQKVDTISVVGRSDILKYMPLNKFPVVNDPYPAAVHPDDWTLWHIAHNDGTNVKALPEEAQELYALVAGPQVTLSKFDADAINYSLDTFNMTLYNILQAKACEFGSCDASQVYIRCTIGHDEGNSPGIPFVLEIWPRLCYSPIHSHSNASAVIKVLHGEITVTNYNQLQDVDEMKPFAENVYYKDQVTWITPELYQTHRLLNANNDTACITIQSYRYPDNDNDHYEYFDFIALNEDKEKIGIGHFYPGSDMTYEELIGKVRYEYMHSEQFRENMKLYRNTPLWNDASVFGSLFMEYI